MRHSLPLNLSLTSNALIQHYESSTDVQNLEKETKKEKLAEIGKNEWEMNILDYMQLSWYGHINRMEEQDCQRG